MSNIDELITGQAPPAIAEPPSQPPEQPPATPEPEPSAQAVAPERQQADRIAALESDVLARDRRIAELQAAAVTTEIESTIATGMIGWRLVGNDEAAQTVTAGVVAGIIRGRLEGARDASGRVHVREKGTGRPAAEVIREIRESPNFKQFFAARSTSDSGANPYSDINRHPMPDFDQGPNDWIAKNFEHRKAGNGSAWLTR